MPDPRPSESWRDFERRCIPAVIREGRKADQAWQICRSIYRRGKTARPRAQAKEAKPLRKGIPSKVWRGFDRAVSKAHGPIRGAFRRSTDELRSAFTLDEAQDALTLFGDLEPLISGPEAILPWRAASEELYDLFLGPRDVLDQDAGAVWLPVTPRRRGPPTLPSAVLVLEPVNADRTRPEDAPIVRAMTDAGAVAASTTEPLRLDWWDRETMRLEMVAWSRDNAAARVTAIDDATRGGIREIVTQAFDPETGVDRDGIARALRALDGSDGRLRLGLDAPRQKSLMKYIDELPAKLPAGRRQKLIDRRFSQLLRARTDTIARTEALTVGNEGQLITWQKAARDGELDVGALILEWVTRSIGVCPRCRALDGATREIESGTFVSDGSGPLGVETPSIPALHPNCLPGDIRVVTDGPPSAATKRRFDGRFISLKTASGRELTATANHPILTQAGWVAAQDLVPGDDVLCDSGFPDRLAGGVDDQDMPPRIEEVENALRLASGVRSVEVPVAHPDFHGDGVGSEVAVVSADGLLGGDRSDPVSEPADQVALGLALVRAAALNPLRLGGQLRLGLRLAALRRLSCEHHVALLLRAGVLHAKLLGSRHSPQLDTGGSEPGRKRSPGDTRGTGDGEEGRAPQVIRDQALDVVDLDTVPRPDSRPYFSEPLREDAATDADLFPDLSQGLAGSVLVDQLVQVRHFDASHDVYNLQTSSGWYVADGFIVHNCYCSTRTIRRQDALREPPAIESAEPAPAQGAPLPRFRTPQEAREWMKRYAGDVDLPNLPLEASQEIAEGLDEVLGGTGSKADRIGWLEDAPPRTSGRHTLDLRNGKTEILIRRSWAENARKKAGAVAANFASRRDDRIIRFEQRIRSETDPLRKAVLESRLSLVEATGRWSAATYSDRPLRTLVAHEAAHETYFKGTVVYKNRRRALSQAWIEALNDMPKNAPDGTPTSVLSYRVSEYANTNAQEMWAEIAALIADGEDWVIPRPFLDLYQELVETYKTVR